MGISVRSHVIYGFYVSDKEARSLSEEAYEQVCGNPHVTLVDPVVSSSFIFGVSLAAGDEETPMALTVIDTSVMVAAAQGFPEIPEYLESLLKARQTKIYAFTQYS